MPAADRHAAPADSAETLLAVGDPLAHYGFPDGHPLSIDRQGAFLQAAGQAGLLARVARLAPCRATPGQIARFHDPAHVDWVRANNRGGGVLDYGDTPAFPGVFDAAATVVGTALAALDAVMHGRALRVFQPIGGLHHARRDRAAGFCVFNDLGVVIDTLREVHGVRDIAYVDIDVHHGDGVYYPYESDPHLVIADIHQDGDTLYPGTGAASEAGRGAAAGTKLNVPLAPGAGDREFLQAWERVEAHLLARPPQIVILQCGADGLAGDPLAHLEYTPAVHAHATRRLRALADAHAHGRMLVFGGGGYHLGNLGAAWSAVLQELL